MVNFFIVSEYSGLPEPGGRVKITGPLYAIERVRELVKDSCKVKLWTLKCIQDVQNLSFEIEDVADLIGLLREHDYRHSEWCENGKNAWAACDAYEVRRREWVPSAQKEMDIRYFLKFAIGKTGSLLLTVSCHT